jgi:Leucine-rich repeat (LRR) protein
VADYIQENGMPPIKFGEIRLIQKGLTSLAGVEKLDGTIYYLFLSNNYITDYYDPYLDPYVYYVVNNRLKRGAIEPFRGFNNLRSLGLNNNKLIELPVGIFKGLENLLEFGLDHNQLRELPVGIFKGLKNLEEFYLNNNQLGELPVGIFKGLENLTQLFLGRNQLRELPVKIFTGLGKLRLLSLKYNYLPDTLDEFKNTHELSKDVKMLFYPQKEIGTQYHQGGKIFYPLRTCPPIHRYPCWC